MLGIYGNRVILCSEKNKELEKLELEEVVVEDVEVEVELRSIKIVISSSNPKLVSKKTEPSCNFTCL
ncbi:hypothetical protein Glove_87g156 [Diversispora epigaea]|uniref:Uncharacterized protein n=1 Tax=Diversispora epigaea TaxID=1348612 RepID=A0A397J9V1_9GLOM|nr:hypothetical protein Glove_87g156 [Diversispora epigaea]